jgi:uncharacterized protein DUF1761
VNPLAILVATVVSIVMAAVYYSQLMKQLATVTHTAVPGKRPELWQMLVDVPRNLLFVLVVAGLASEIGADGWLDGLMLGLALWIGFPVVIWMGTHIHERRPLKYAAIHMGDWLLRLPVIAIIVTVWQ